MATNTNYTIHTDIIQLQVRHGPHQYPISNNKSDRLLNLSNLKNPSVIYSTWLS